MYELLIKKQAHKVYYALAVVAGNGAGHPSGDFEFTSKAA